jgi:N-acetylmuramic acid 6-phosphate etherase
VKRLWAGIDGGGSKTRAVVCGDDLIPRGRGSGGPSNPSRTPIARVLEVLHEALEEALASAGVRAEELRGVCCGLAGIEATGLADRLRAGLEKSFESTAVALTTDARIALAAATTGPVGAPGVVLIAGTGAIAFGRNAAGEEARAGGWGPLLGDEGSGYAIAREGLSAVVRDLDGRGERTLLRSTVLSSEGVHTPAELLQKLQADSRPSGVAAFFPLVLDAAREGDEVSRAIFRRAGSELGLAVATVVRRLGMEREAFTVATVGGVFESGELILEPLRASIAGVAPGARVAPAAYPPEIGAVRLALAAEREGRA